MVASLRSIYFSVGQVQVVQGAICLKHWTCPWIQKGPHDDQDYHGTGSSSPGREAWIPVACTDSPHTPHDVRFLLKIVYRRVAATRLAVGGDDHRLLDSRTDILPETGALQWTARGRWTWSDSGMKKAIEITTVFRKFSNSPCSLVQHKGQGLVLKFYNLGVV